MGVGTLLQAGHEVEVRVWLGWHLVVLGVEAGKNFRWQLIHLLAEVCGLAVNTPVSNESTLLPRRDSL